MKFKKMADNYLIRFERGEEVLGTLKEFCGAMGITFAAVSAIGATENITIGLFDPVGKTYISNQFDGPFEILSLSGSVTSMAGEVYLHLHITVGDIQGNTRGGHLNRAVVNPTCEMILQTGAAVVDRFFDEDTGLNLLKI